MASFLPRSCAAAWCCLLSLAFSVETARSAQLVIWSFDSLSGLSNGSTVAASAEVLTGSPLCTIRNSDIYSSGQTGVSYTDAGGTARAAGKAIGWSDFKKSGQPVDGQLDLSLNATGYGTMSLRFDYKHSLDNDSSENKLQMVCSTNGGSTWGTPVAFTVTDSNSWKSKTLLLPSSLNGQSSVVVRIEKDASTTNATEVNSILLFDNVEITGTASGGGGSSTPVLTISSNVTGVPATNPAALSGVIGDTQDPARQAIVISTADSDTADANLTGAVTSSSPSVATATLLRQTSGGQDTFTLSITPLAVGYTNFVVTISDPQSNAATYTLNYAVSAASNTPSASRYYTGASDASAAFPVDANYMFVANDEDEVLRLYPRTQSGPPVAALDIRPSLGIAKEADLEAVIRVGNRLYWIGSHGNDREGNAEPTRNMCFATDLSGSGASATLSYVSKFTNLKSNLISWDNANGHGLGSSALGLSASAAAGVLPTVAQGFNIEGAAYLNGKCYLGFRAPLQNTSARNKALVIPVNNFTTVLDSGSGTMQFSAPIFLDLGGRCIRDMAVNASGQILILAGPVGDTATVTPAFALYLWDGQAATTPVRVSSAIDAAATSSTGSPEAIVEVPASISLNAQVQILHDCGTVDFYNDGTEAKDLSVRSFAKARSDLLTLGQQRIVTTSVDENNVVPGTGLSLREAVAAASFPDGISFAASLNGGTLTLSNGQLTLAESVEIDASSLSNGITISGNNSSRVLEIAAGKSVSLRSLSIINGRASGGSFPGNAGAGILNSGTLSLNNVTLSGNVANGQGGALSNSGTLSLANVTVSGSSAGTQGGALASSAGTVTLNHCTLSANSATTQGGGLAVLGGSATLTNTIVAGNTAASAANVQGTVSGSGNYLNGNALLAPLANYGGTTRTMPPLPGSPVIDGTASTTLATDQRGAARPVGPLPDIGATEAVIFSTVTLVDTDADGIDDRLEPAYGLTVGSNDATKDSDGDGLTDKEELACMTNPLDPASRLKITSNTQTGTEAGTGKPVFQFTFPTYPGLEYELESSTTLLNFQPIAGTRFTATGYSKTLSVPLQTGRDFVRVKRL